MPVRDEEENIIEVYQKFKNFSIDFELIFIDDFSKDKTFKIINDLTIKHSYIKLYKNKKKGLGGAISEGIDKAKKNYVTIMMCDSSDSIDDLKKYYKLIKNNKYDAIFGSRFIKGSKVSGYPIKKMILNRIFNLFVSLVFLNKFSDYTNAFKIYKLKSLKQLKPFVSENFNIFLELPLKIISRKMKYKITSISWVGRQKGTSKFFTKELRSQYIFTLLYCFLEKILIQR